MQKGKKAFQKRVRLARIFLCGKHATNEHRAIVYADNKIKELENKVKELQK